MLQHDKFLKLLTNILNFKLFGTLTNFDNYITLNQLYGHNNSINITVFSPNYPNTNFSFSATILLIA